MRSPRSRSPPLLRVLSPEYQEEHLAEFARVYWTPPDSKEVPPWKGQRARAVQVFREHLVSQVELAASDEDERFLLHTKEQLSTFWRRRILPRWCAYTFFEDLAKMSDVLFRGPIDAAHAQDTDIRLSSAWRRISATIFDIEEFEEVVAPFRVSAVRVAIILETARPAEAAAMDGLYELPDARTLASLLHLRCHKDFKEEIAEMYRLLFRKLGGTTCSWCSKPLDEDLSLCDGCSDMAIPMIPRVFVPQCGHAIHAVCFANMLVGDFDPSERGRCRQCFQPFGWSAIDVDPLVSAFCWNLGRYVDQGAQEIRATGEVLASRPLVHSCAGACEAFSQELNGLISPSVAWIALTKRHCFLEREVVSLIGDLVLRALSMPPGSAASGEQENGSLVGEADSQAASSDVDPLEDARTVPPHDLDSDVSTEAWQCEVPPPSDDEDVLQPSSCGPPCQAPEPPVPLPVPAPFIESSTPLCVRSS